MPAAFTLMTLSCPTRCRSSTTHTFLMLLDPSKTRAWLVSEVRYSTKQNLVLSDIFTLRYLALKLHHYSHPTCAILAPRVLKQRVVVALYCLVAKS